MKAKELMEKTTPELNERIKELKAELFNLRFQLATGQLQQHHGDQLSASAILPVRRLSSAIVN